MSSGYALAEVMTGGDGFAADREKSVTAPAVAHVSPATQYDPSLIEAFFGMSEPDRSEPEQHSRLRCSGSIQIAGKSWINTDRYLTADHIGRISSKRVTLTVDTNHISTGI